MKDRVTVRIANDFLEPLAQFTSERLGSLAELTRRLSKATKKDWNRASVERWLAPDKAKRIQPLLGAGLLLKAIGDELMAEAEEPPKKGK